MDTLWVLGDQLNRHLGVLRDARPGDVRILLVQSEAKLRSKRWHRQRLHVVLAAMRRFAAELEAEGFAVELRMAPSLRAGLDAHRRAHRPHTVLAMEPASAPGLALLRDLAVQAVRSDQFLCHYDEFAAWAGNRRTLRMEDFYRWQRRRLGYLMDGDQPAGGRWNFDADNREPPPAGEVAWPEPVRQSLDDVDAEVARAVERYDVWGAPYDGLWATSRSEALRRLDHAMDQCLPRFGPHEDAMLTTSWHLAHTLLSPYLNLGLLHPGEVADAAEDAYRAGRAPIASAEGFVRQVIGWREYVWGLYWRDRERFRGDNALGAARPVPPALTGAAPTRMRCLAHTLRDLHDHGWAHHIQRLMVLGNLALLAGVDPQAMTEWMWAGFVDGAEWVMLPNVVGMALHADGGRMATKPYAAGGAYIDRMSDYCRGCTYDRRKRTGDDACPYTTLYWDFLARHAGRFARNPRVAQQVRAAERLGDLPAVRERAREVLERLDAGTL